MKTILLAGIMLWGMTAMAQSKAYDISKDEKTGDLVFNGPLTFEELYNERSFAWLKSSEAEYRPDEATINFLKNRLKDYEIVVFLGTWCEDSHYLVPKLAKVLHMTSYPMSSVTMYGVDREKTTKGGEQKKYSVTLVPTIILYKNGQEAGRITEAALKSIEADLAAIVK